MGRGGQTVVSQMPQNCRALEVYIRPSTSPMPFLQAYQFPAPRRALRPEQPASPTFTTGTQPASSCLVQIVGPTALANKANFVEEGLNSHSFPGSWAKAEETAPTMRQTRCFAQPSWRTGATKRALKLRPAHSDLQKLSVLRTRAQHSLEPLAFTSITGPIRFSSHTVCTTCC